mmetsp:Transcript_44232/g.104097  ORF Transcript_44232/g.104097 Transcript_44232/m.104097 type:complete len:344 (+) Transcript_44232:158-1189(+)
MWTKASATLFFVLALYGVEWCSAVGCCEHFCQSFVHNATSCESADGLSACPDDVLSTGNCACGWISVSQKQENYACVAVITLEEQPKMELTTEVIAIVATVGGLIFCCCLGYNVVMCCGYDDEDDDDDDYKKPGESEEDFEFRRAASAFKRAPPKAAATTKSKSRRQSLRLGWRRISSIVIGGKTESLKAITQKTVQNSRMLTFVSSGKFSSVQQTGLAGARDVKNQQGISPVKPWAVQQQGSANKVESSTRSLGNKSFKQPEHTAITVASPADLIQQRSSALALPKQHRLSLTEPNRFPLSERRVEELIARLPSGGGSNSSGPGEFNVQPGARGRQVDHGVV